MRFLPQDGHGSWIGLDGDLKKSSGFLSDLKKKRPFNFRGFCVPPIVDFYRDYRDYHSILKKKKKKGWLHNVS